MSGPDPHLPDDRELEDFLTGRGPHARRYREAANESAPPSLDAAILDQARMAVPAPKPRARRWQLPVSLAATVVLGIGLASRVQREAELPPEIAAAPVVQEVQAPAVAMAEIESAARAAATVPVPPAVSTAPVETERREAHAQPKREVARAQAARAAVAAAEPQASDHAAGGAPAVAAAPPPPPPPAPPRSAPAPEAMADATAARAEESALMAQPVPAAPPPVAAFAGAAPRMKSLAPSRVAPAFPGLPDGEYRNAAGDLLQLLADDSFRLLPAGAQEPRYRGHRATVQGGERLLMPPADGEADACSLVLHTTGEADVIELQAAQCAGSLAGRYRRVAKGAGP